MSRRERQLDRLEQSIRRLTAPPVRDELAAIRAMSDEELIRRATELGDTTGAAMLAEVREQAAARAAWAVDPANPFRCPACHEWLPVPRGPVGTGRWQAAGTCPACGFVYGEPRDPPAPLDAAP